MRNYLCISFNIHQFFILANVLRQFVIHATDELMCVPKFNSTSDEIPQHTGFNSLFTI